LNSILLKKEILKDRSSSHRQFLIEQINNSPDLYSHLIDYSFDKNQVLAFRASWILDNVTEKYPTIISQPSHLHKIINKVVTLSNYSVIRAIVRLLTRINIPEKYLGTIVHQCFLWLEASQTPIAVKVHCMQILLNAVKRQPELKNELQMAIQTQLPFGSKGYKARGKRIIEELDNIF